ncbi:hypothetical protein LguiA_029666 [Lonicera macranthoides]
MGPELANSRAAIKWATDYLLKCARATPGKLYVGVGDPNADHKCWERPEDMDTVRTVYSVSARNPGSDVARETAAALAAASLVFLKVDPTYSKLLLRTAKSVFQFATQYGGSYSDSLGSDDEFLWGAAWLFRATNDASYISFINSLGANDDTDIFSWDNKYAGARVLLSRMDYILGVNLTQMSYMVGYGTNYPRTIHHRGSSLPSVKGHPQSIRCEDGFQPYYSHQTLTYPNILTGAIVGGPDQNDFFPDDRMDYSHSELATYINGSIVGSLAYLAGSYKS